MRRKLPSGAFEKASTPTVSERGCVERTVRFVSPSHVSSTSLLSAGLSLKRNLNVTENFSLQLDYLVNDTNYPGLEGTVQLHFNVTVLPVHIHFPNVTLTFTLTRRAAVYAQVRFYLLLVGNCSSSFNRTCFHLVTEI